MRALDNIVFDVGNVLYEWDIRHLYEKLIDDPDRLDWFIGNVVTAEWHFQHDRGRPFAETSAELIALHPEEADLIRAFGPRFNETIPGPVPGMIELATELHGRGLRLFGITNFSGEFWRGFRPTASIFDLFADIVVSGDEQLVKPDPAIFELAKSRFGVASGNSLFVDDRPENVEAARDAGFEAHLFVDRAGLDEALAGYRFAAD
ncbi:MAG: HAD family phosphatase [Pacificimonas sp.]